jgi:tetratricopeptide (TPR) repeat protein
MGRLDRAEAALKMALEIKPDLVSGLRNLGTLYLKARRFEDATVVLARAVAIDPDHASTQRKLALACFEQGNEAGAEEHLRRALELGELAEDARTDGGKS